MRESHDSLRQNVDNVFLLCPRVDLGELGPDGRTCPKNVGLQAAMFGVMCLMGFRRRVAYLGFRHFPASALERAIVLLAKLFPQSQERLKRLRPDTRPGHEKAFATLPARRRLDVAIVCVIAIVAFLLNVRSSRAAVTLVGTVLASESPSHCTVAFFVVCVPPASPFSSSQAAVW